MPDLILDMSQAVINRTAMFTISMDTLETLRGCCAGLQLFGQRVALDTPLSTRRDDARRLYDMLGHISEGRLPSVRSPSNDAVRTLYLDPLYTLLGALGSNDIVMLLDMSPVTTPAWHSPAAARAYRLAFELIAQAQPRVLAISFNTAECLRANYGFPSERIAVVPLYLPRHLEAEVVPTYPVAPYVLFVGSLEERKNLVGAIHIFRLSGLAARGYELLVVGGRGQGAEAIEALASTTLGVRLAGFVTNEQLASLYAGAAAFLYPSYLEGFGVPLVEALYAGLPCVVSYTGAIPEIGGDVVRYADPDDHKAFAAHLNQLVLLDPASRQDIAARGRARVAKNFRFHHYQAALRAAIGLEPLDSSLLESRDAALSSC
jgi:glycosyltransferase involved in cell wall biosynthesis